MRFRVLKQTLGGRLLLAAEEAQAVAKPLSLRLGRKKVGAMVETIGRVSSPLYVAEAESAKKLVGKELESG